MVTAPTFWSRGDYRLPRAGGSVDVLATEDGGFRVDVAARAGGDAVDKAALVSAYGFFDGRAKLGLGDDAAADMNTDLLRSGQIGYSYLAFGGRDTAGAATVFIEGTSRFATVSAANADCYAMFGSVALSGGGLLSLWGQTVDGGEHEQVVFRAVSKQGHALAEVTAAPSEAGHDQTDGILSKLTDGTLVIGWQDAAASSAAADLVIGRYTQAGEALSGPVTVAGITTGAATAVQALAGGGFVVAWDDAASDHSTLQLFAADGTALGGPLAVTGDLTGAATALHDGGFVLGVTLDGASLLQCFAADGTAIGDAVTGSGELVTLEDGRFAAADASGFTIHDARDHAILGTADDDTIYGRRDGSEITSLAGNDKVSGSDEIDIVHAGRGDDWVISYEGDDQLFGDDGDDSLYGAEGADVLDGGGGKDFLAGYTGIDLMSGGGGADTLLGGDGADLFIYRDVSDSAGDAADRIEDFHFGRDRIDLHLIDADQRLAGTQHFTFIGTAAFSAAGQVRYEVRGHDTLVEAEVTGDGVADLRIILSHEFYDLRAADFILDAPAARPVAEVGIVPSSASHLTDWPALLHLA